MLAETATMSIENQQKAKLHIRNKVGPSGVALEKQPNSVTNNISKASFGQINQTIQAYFQLRRNNSHRYTQTAAADGIDKYINELIAKYSTVQ
jgi:hypothetical protein